ncbi:hypothetical protein [Paenibacillus whitsoniae]|uniref:Uncharacterized protein n=1 Tax=Paenibacillus whitsoniae TaxID=2496558 RepID=A0A3S0AN45_9BACL|nr:hypothetical protein [Paenibacillus whitsoniae]RTE08238.1 hypothetical protein EJQ19_18545 [Paenibacillus whitsoniae]
MRSFAIWYAPIKKETEQETEQDKVASIHINLWDKVKGNNKNYCFDFGLLIEDINCIEKIFLYAPFPVEKKQIKDLGSVISNNQLVNAIFNENFTTTDGEPKRLIVNAPEKKDNFVVYSLEIENQVELINCRRNTESDGTIIEIKVDSIKPNNINKYYFRIRIEGGKDCIKFINDEIKGISIFSNQFTNTEVIDFRLNDVRSCSEELREQFQKGKSFKLLAIHYLILRNANDAIIHYGKEINSRMLEQDLWKTYIDGTNHNIIAYHIKSKAEKKKNPQTGGIEVLRYVEDFSDLSRFQYQKETKSIIALYVLGVIVLGGIGGVLGNWLSSIIGL